MDGRPIRIAPAGALVVGKPHPCEVFFDPLYVFRVASLLVDVFDDPATADRLGRNGRELVTREFAWPVLLQQWLRRVGKVDPQ